MSRSALRLAGVCALSLTSAKAAVEPHVSGADEQALFQSGLRIEPQVLSAGGELGEGSELASRESAIAALRRRPGNVSLQHVVQQLGAYVDRGEGSEVIRKATSALRTLSALSDRLRISLNAIAARGDLGLGLHEVVFNGVSEFASAALGRQAGDMSRRARPAAGHQGEDNPPGGDKANGPSLGELANLTHTLLKVVESQEWMQTFDEHMATCHSSTLTFSETVVWTVNGVVSDCRDANATEIVRMMSEVLNTQANAMKDMFATQISGARNLLSKVPADVKGTFAEQLQTLTLMDNVLQNMTARPTWLEPGAVSTEEFCGKMDETMAFFEKIVPVADKVIQACHSFDEQVLPMVRNYFTQYDAALAPRVVYMYAAINEATNYSVSQMRFQVEKWHEALPILSGMGCGLPKLAAIRDEQAQAKKSAGGAAAPESDGAESAAQVQDGSSTERSSGSSRVAGPRWGVWPLFAATIAIASLLSL